ncbi:MAG: SDR family oxidoreductase [Devosia sp.]|nr:SDR family oxidoreductase [Devosia sp.]
MPDRPGAVLVLGASRGLGRAIAVAGAEAGFAVVLGCREVATGEPTAARLRARGLRASAIGVDVTNYDAVAAAVEHAVAFGAPLVGIVNNAGIIGPLAPIEATAPDAWSQAISVNLVGAYHGTRAALPRLADGGVIVNLSSGAASQPLAGWSAYCAAKAGLAMLTRCTHAEHGERLRVYGARPGMLDTDMQAEVRASGLGPASRIAQRSLGAPSVAARAVAWLLGVAPEDLSGTEIELDSVALQLRMGPLPGGAA